MGVCVYFFSFGIKDLIIINYLGLRMLNRDFFFFSG